MSVTEVGYDLAEGPPSPRGEVSRRRAAQEWSDPTFDAVLQRICDEQDAQIRKALGMAPLGTHTHSTPKENQ